MKLPSPHLLINVSSKHLINEQREPGECLAKIQRFNGKTAAKTTPLQPRL